MRLSALSNLKYFAQGAGAILVSCICTKIIWEKNSATTAAESETFLGSEALGCSDDEERSDNEQENSQGGPPKRRGEEVSRVGERARRNRDGNDEEASLGGSLVDKQQ